MQSLTLCLLVAAAALCAVHAAEKHDYCLIGAGPSGLEIGMFLSKAGRDYKIFEANGVPGSSFNLYPRHRELISINKRHTGRTNLEFNLRHDWNSILADAPDKHFLFGTYTDKYFPDADFMLQYLADYTKKYNLNVQYNTMIEHVDRAKSAGCNYDLKDQKGMTYCCRTVISCTGLPNMKPIEGEKWIEPYETMNVDPKNYTNQAVLILGSGNSGMEVAKSIYGEAAFVHIAARSRIKFSWDTHYVGDVRGINNEVIDAYMLKSLDAIAIGRTNDFKVVKRPDGRLALNVIDKTDNLPSKDHHLEEAIFSSFGYDRIIKCTGFKWDSDIYEDKESLMNKDIPKYPKITETYQGVGHPNLYFAGTMTHSRDWRGSSGGFIHGFRYTARALFRHLEWKNNAMPWPSVTHSLDHLVAHAFRRINEASGIYQMFTTYGDVAIVDRNTNKYTYLEEVPVAQLQQITENTGHMFDPRQHSLVVITMEYGANWSLAELDHFGERRAHNTYEDAHYQVFLHPVFRVFHKDLATAERMEYKHDCHGPELHGREKSDAQRFLDIIPDGIQHVRSDFSTEFDAPVAHLLPARRMLEFQFGKDLKAWSGADCAKKILESQWSQCTLPVACQTYLQSS